MLSCAKSAESNKHSSALSFPRTPGNLSVFCFFSSDGEQSCGTNVLEENTVQQCYNYMQHLCFTSVLNIRKHQCGQNLLQFTQFSYACVFLCILCIHSYMVIGSQFPPTLSCLLFSLWMLSKVYFSERLWRILKRREPRFEARDSSSSMMSFGTLIFLPRSISTSGQKETCKTMNGLSIQYIPGNWLISD